jgi:hypothetical protein
LESMASSGASIDCEMNGADPMHCTEIASMRGDSGGFTVIWGGSDELSTPLRFDRNNVSDNIVTVKYYGPICCGWCAHLDF